MTSSSLVASPSAPNWQVDIPGLTQLIINVGSHGLKQLALAGVDIHSIGCMLMIAEFTPASQDFRKKITNARNIQRSEKLWLYRVVEIGAATNFLADQLLKTRAGENVLALMAATVPVMDEKTCTSTLIALFEGAKISPDNIPGLNQLQTIRTELATLARKVGFSEKVLIYHKFLCSLRSKHGAMLNQDPYSAIPLATDIASIIRMLHKIVSNDDDHYVFICWGLRGAAWIMAYGNDVLGLPVCAVQGDRTPIPITGSYDNAKILIELDSGRSRCGVYLKKDLQEQLVIELRDADSGGRRGWSVDCGIVNFLEYRHPKISMSESLGRISTFTALETLNQVSTLASAIPTWTKNRMAFQNAGKELGFVSYAESELHHIQARSLRILRQLGFQAGALSEYRFAAANECPTYTANGHVSDPPVIEIETEEEYYDYNLRKKLRRKYKSRNGQYIAEGSLLGKSNTDRIRYYVADPRDYDEDEYPAGSSSNFQDRFLEWRTDVQYSLAETIRIASHFAAHLAFSDWDVSLRQMSARFLQLGETSEGGTESGCFEAHMSSAIMLCADSLDLSTLENKLWSTDWIALDLDGVIIHRNTARYHSIHDLRGKFLGFTAGKIVFEGNMCSKVRSDRVGVRYPSFGTGITGCKKAVECIPSLLFRDLSVRTLLSAVKETLFVRLEGLLSGRALVADASLVGSSLPDTLVSTPCPHKYYEKTAPQAPQSPRDRFRCISSEQIHIVEGLIFHKDPRSRDLNAKLHISYQLVDNSPLGQWLACHWKSENERAVRIIQKDCCFGCILQRVQRLYDVLDMSRYRLSDDGLDVCIIAGGFQEQQLWPQRRLSSPGPPMASPRTHTRADSDPTS